MSFYRIDITLFCYYDYPMSRKPFTLRLNPAERIALESLAKIERRPMNQILNEAVTAYLQRGGPVERDLEASLEKLRAYRRRDPDFETAIGAFANSEAKSGKDDPVEGEVVIGELVDGRLVQETSTVQKEIHQLLDA